MLIAKDTYSALKVLAVIALVGFVAQRFDEKKRSTSFKQHLLSAEQSAVATAVPPGIERPTQS